MLWSTDRMKITLHLTTMIYYGKIIIEEACLMLHFPETVENFLRYCTSFLLEAWKQVGLFL